METEEDIGLMTPHLPSLVIPQPLPLSLPQISIHLAITHVLSFVLRYFGLPFFLMINFCFIFHS